MKLVGSTYYVMRDDGLVTHSGSDATTVINGALSAMSGLGKTLTIMGGVTHTLSGALTPGSSTTIKSDSMFGLARLHANGAFPAISIDATSAGKDKISLLGLYLTHDSASYDNIGLIQFKTNDATAGRAITSCNVGFCHFYDTNRLKGNAIRYSLNLNPIYKVNVFNCEMRGFQDEICYDAISNDANTWANNNTFTSINGWFPDRSFVRLQSAGSTSNWDDNPFVNCHVQSGANNDGYDYSTAFTGTARYNSFVSCMVWDLQGTHQGWRFNNTCEVSLIGCIPDTKVVTEAGTKIHKTGYFSKPINGLPSVKKTGWWTGLNSGDGLMASPTTAGAAADVDATNGRGAKYSTTTSIGTWAGLRCTTSLSIRQWNPVFRFKFRLTQTNATDIRFFFGLISATTALPNTDDQLTGIHGIGINIRSTDTVWQIGHNDGSGATTWDAVTGSPAIDTNVHTVIIIADDTNARFGVSWDGGVYQYISSNIPTQTGGLIPQAGIINVEAEDKAFTNYWAEIESDK